MISSCLGMYLHIPSGDMGEGEGDESELTPG